MGEHTPKYVVKAGKVPKPLPAAVTARIVELVVDQALDMADVCKIVFRNDDFSISDNPDFKPGSKLQVELGYQEVGGGKTRSVFKGEITAVQCDFPRRSPMSARVIAHTEYHRLMRGTHIRSWEQRTYSDIAKEIAKECNLEPACDATSEKHEYVFQRNQTNLEFLLECAERVGFEAFAGEGRLFFRRPCHDGMKVRTLKKGERLLTFNPRSRLALHPTGVKVISWDDKEVQQVTAEAKAGEGGPSMDGKQLGPKLSEKAIGTAIQVVTEQIFRKQQPAKIYAVGELKNATLDFVRAEAVVQGSPELRPGFLVECREVGAIFSGPYYIVRVAHDYLPTGWTTRLGLKKTSIETVPKPPPSDLDESEEDLGDIGLESWRPSEEPAEDLGGEGPELKNTKLSVGDEPPDWFFESEDLEGLDLLKILGKGYMGPPEPVLKLEPEKKSVHAPGKIKVKVTYDKLERVKLKLEPDNIARLNKDLLKANGEVELQGFRDGKVTITAEGIKLGGVRKAVSEVIEVIGPQIQMHDRGYQGPKMIVTPESTECDMLGKNPIKLKVEFENVDFVNLKPTPPDGCWLPTPSVKQPGSVDFKGKKDGKVVIRAEGVIKGHVKLTQDVEIQVIGPPLKAHDCGYDGPKLIASIDKSELQHGTTATVNVQAEHIQNISLRLEPADLGSLGATSLGGPGNVTFTAGKKHQAGKIAVSGVYEGRKKFEHVLDVQVTGPQLKMADAGYQR